MRSHNEAARILEGDVVAGGQIVFRAPGHSHADRSASVKFGPKFGPEYPDDFVVNSWAGDPFGPIRDHIKERLLGSSCIPRAPRPRSFIRDEAPSEDAEAKIKKAEASWKKCQDPRGTVVETYLKRPKSDGGRGLSELPDDVAGSVIRFRPDCPWTDETTGETLRVPAMISVYRDIHTDRITGLHRRRLTPEGRKVGKPKTLQVVRGSAIKIDADEAVCQGLVVGEGVETCLAAREFGYRPVWALGPAGAFGKFPLLSGIECITLLAEDDDHGANERAIDECASRWHAAHREVIVVESRTGGDLNDALVGSQ
jgi:putative DNA primase/helicase